MENRMSHRTAMSTLTDWVLAHQRIVVGLWMVLTIAGFAAIEPAGQALSQKFTVPGREGFETQREDRRALRQRRRRRPPCACRDLAEGQNRGVAWRRFGSARGDGQSRQRP